MAAPTHHQQTPAERLIATTITSTWLLWLLGALYIVGPVLGWTLAAMAAKRLYLAPGLPPEERPLPLGSLVWVWLIGMLFMLAALLVGHVTNDLGAAKTLKSSVGWAKGWALLGLFPFAAAVLDVRPAVIYHAVCRLGRQTLVLLPVFLAAPLIGLPGLLYTSPLEILGGSGPEFFKVILYTIEPGTGATRYQFFAPWSPAAGMIAVIHVLCAIEERDRRWQIVGVLAGLAVALLSQSRLALVAIAVVWPIAQGVARLRRPSTWWLAAPAVLGIGLFAPTVLALVDKLANDFKG
ncbi:O-antigen ligase domain-containing protein, partial [Sandarakinorhabdus sp.]|uniref:O-antigen ligase domain-containing protein n=1 Tax=Sandarakinorhabdus sp. TaxID=1916663 RepID=UPI003340ABD1